PKVMLLAWLSAAVVVLPDVALALSVDRAVVKFNARKGDGFVLKGRLGALPVDGVDSVEMAFGSFVEQVPRASLVEKGQRLVFKAPRARGLRTLVLDTA